MAYPHLSAARVLVVEDDVDTLDSLKDVLAFSGAKEIRLAVSIEEAERLLRSGFSPSIVLLNLCLGGTCGEDFARRLRSDAAYRTVPLVAISGNVVRLRLSRTNDCIDCGLQKPFDVDELLGTLEELLAPGPRTAPSRA